MCDIFIHVYIYMILHTDTHINLQERVLVCISVYREIYTCIDIHIRMYIFIGINTYTYIDIYIYLRVHTALLRICRDLL